MPCPVDAIKLTSRRARRAIVASFWNARSSWPGLRTASVTVVHSSSRGGPRGGMRRALVPVAVLSSSLVFLLGGRRYGLKEGCFASLANPFENICRRFSDGLGSDDGHGEGVG